MSRCTQKLLRPDRALDATADVIGYDGMDGPYCEDDLRARAPAAAAVSSDDFMSQEADASTAGMAVEAATVPSPHLYHHGAPSAGGTPVPALHTYHYGYGSAPGSSFSGGHAQLSALSAAYPSMGSPLYSAPPASHMS